jgi:hypothetical protein
MTEADRGIMRTGEKMVLIPIENTSKGWLLGDGNYEELDVTDLPIGIYSRLIRRSL